MVRIPTDRAPVHAGDVLREEFLNPLGLTQRALADAIDLPYRRVNELVNGRRDMTPSTALRLSRFFGTTPGYWLNIQRRWDLHHAQKEEADALARITRHPRGGSNRPEEPSANGIRLEYDFSGGERGRHVHFDEIAARARAAAQRADIQPSHIEAVVDRVRAEANRLPQFRSEDEERAFWSEHDSTDYLDWRMATSDPGILGGMPVFTGTRVPIRTFFDYLIAGDEISSFLDDYPTVTSAKVTELLTRIRDELLNRPPSGSKNG